MNKHMIGSILCFTLLISTMSFADTSTTTKTIKTEKPICLISGNPNPSDFKVIRKIKAGKGTYGSFENVYPRFKAIATKYDADAVVNYNASQRFGFWPWRIVRPVLTGTAVKWQGSSPFNCTRLGGKEI